MKRFGAQPLVARVVERRAGHGHRRSGAERARLRDGVVLLGDVSASCEECQSGDGCGDARPPRIRRSMRAVRRRSMSWGSGMTAVPNIITALRRVGPRLNADQTAASVFRGRGPSSAAPPQRLRPRQRVQGFRACHPACLSSPPAGPLALVRSVHSISALGARCRGRGRRPWRTGCPRRRIRSRQRRVPVPVSASGRNSHRIVGAARQRRVAVADRGVHSARVRGHGGRSVLAARGAPRGRGRMLLSLVGSRFSRPAPAKARLPRPLS